eukprot:m.138428 g.138428  ORF g.138428 m.138428 type:complete len:174 (+) comp22725_c0_seq1:941-1462(+)
MTAALHGRTAALAVLLQVPGVTAALDAVDSCSQSALHSAVIGGSADSVASLLAAGANIELTDMTAAGVLHLAAAAGDGSEFFHTSMKEADANLVQLLSELDARGMVKVAIDAADRRGLRPLHHAAIAGHCAAARRLLAAGADRRLVDSHGRTAATFALQHHHTEMAILLDEHD